MHLRKTLVAGITIIIIILCWRYYIIFRVSPFFCVVYESCIRRQNLGAVEVVREPVYSLVRMDGSRRIQLERNQEFCTTSSMLDIYADRGKYMKTIPGIPEYNFVQFASTFIIKSSKLQR